MSKLSADETILSLAATVTDRACELITEGWTKNRMRSGAGGVQSFCIHGAIDLAMDEMFGSKNTNDPLQRDVEQIAVAFICDEAFGDIKRATTGIPAAVYNDARNRKHQEVINVMERATSRLWNVAFSMSPLESFEFSKWADVEEAAAQQYLHNSLAN